MALTVPDPSTYPETLLDVSGMAGGSALVEGVGNEVAGMGRQAAVVARSVQSSLRRRSALPALVASDAVALAAALFLGLEADYVLHGQSAALVAASSLPYAAVFAPLFWAYGLYRRPRRRLVASMFPDLNQLLHAVLLSSLLVFAVSPRLHQFVGLPLIGLGEAFLIGVSAMVTVPAARVVARSALRPSGGRSKVLVVGSGYIADVVVQRLKSVNGMDIVGCVDDGTAMPSSPDGPPRLGRLNDLSTVVRYHNVDHVVVAFSPTAGSTLASLLRSLAGDVRISVVPRLFDLLTIRSHVDDLQGMPVVDVAPPALGPADRFAKRAIDLLVAATGLALTLPLMIGIAVAVKAASPGPILFRQQRAGKRGKPFRINKFRTMRIGADGERLSLAGANEVDGPLFKVREDPRMTPIGAFLRKTSLDELPQLVNVLVGHMSLVGPRPFVPSESAAIEGWASRRFDVRPGITGLWQISGRSDLPFDELCRLDYSYVASWSLSWDLRILWNTPGAVLLRRGAY